MTLVLIKLRLEVGTRVETQELGFETRELGFETRELGFETRELGFETRELGFETRESGFETRELELSEMPTSSQDAKDFNQEKFSFLTQIVWMKCLNFVFLYLIIG